MELTIALGWGGWIALIIGALVFGLIAQFIGTPKTGYEWLVDAVAAGIGAIVASEFITAWRAFEPVWDGLALIPAVIGGIVLGVIVEIVTRYATGGSYAQGPVTA
jgi:uncharacterized membrane protein YeaQ/YmgE (transglycosylase-associated protein family)